MSETKIIHDNRDEMIDAVDENDIVLFSATKDEIYERGLRKRIANIVIIDPVTKKIALQKRGKHISWQPDHYAVSACGHVGAGESWEEGAKRELKEELGIEAELKFLSKKPYTCVFSKEFILGTFIAYVPHGDLKPDAREVSEILSLEILQVREILNKGEKLQNIFAPVMTEVLESLS